MAFGWPSRARSLLAAGLFGALIAPLATAGDAPSALRTVAGTVSADIGQLPVAAELAAVVTDGIVQEAAVSVQVGSGITLGGASARVVPASYAPAVPPAEPSTPAAAAMQFAAGPGVGSMGASAVPPAEPPTPAVAETPDVGSSVAFCDVAEAFYMSVVARSCPNVNGDVACVYTTIPACATEDICAFRNGCGYVQDNDFVKFSSARCTGTGSVGPEGPTGQFQIECTPVVTSMGVTLLVAAALALIAGCGCGVWCCCCRGRR